MLSRKDKMALKRAELNLDIESDPNDNIETRLVRAFVVMQSKQSWLEFYVLNPTLNEDGTPKESK